MRTIKLSTAYQLVLTSLLLGACLGTVSQRIPTTFTGSIQHVQAKAIAEENPVAIVRESMVNLRNAPGFHGAIVGSAMRGQELKIIGRDATNSWWLVCCGNSQTVWIAASLVTVQGVTSDIHIVTATAADTDIVPVARYAQTATVADNTTMRAAIQPTVAPPMPTPLPSYAFAVAEQRQHGEQLIPRIFLYVHDREMGLGKFSLRVQKDGILLPVNTRTVAGTPGYTWPLPNERQHFTNLKLEFPDVPAAGQWEVQLVDERGNTAGPAVNFALKADDLNKEMYVRYELR